MKNWQVDRQQACRHVPQRQLGRRHRLLHVEKAVLDRMWIDGSEFKWSKEAANQPA
jgi:hypothetical protein